MMDRKILACHCYKTGYGTHYYDIKYKGIWSDDELINAIDNKVYDNPRPEQLICNNYGGFVDVVYCDDNITRANVGVYYD
ncbi:MAG: hypothetical protein LUH05_03050 [Candidatus Gastranaerophilales bacterium]|nr:hypothetical protein [Candidatus Gastranaerophilales bacterium]